MPIPTVFGTDGDDVLNGTEGADVFLSLLGNDTQNGLGGDDIFILDSTKAQVDTIDGGEGTDTWFGRAINDVFRVLSNFANLTSVEVIDGGDGFDRIEGTAGDDVLDFSTAPFTLVSIEQFDGGQGNDTITGTEEADIITGGGGNDTMFGLGGDDIFTLKGRQGRDILDGGDGFDTYQGTRFNDTFFVTSNFASLANIELVEGGAGFDKIAGSKGDDILDFSAPGFAFTSIEQFEGGNGNDTITGTENDDRIFGGRGNDIIRVEGANVGLDFMNGGGGFDTWQGSAGDDVFNVASGFTNFLNIQTIDGQGGNDVIRGTGDADVLDFSSLGNVTITGIELFDGASGNDIITGTTSADTIAGGRGIDSLFGLAGDDTFLNGGTLAALDTVIDGGADNDTWQGIDGSDDSFFTTSGFGNLVSIENVDGGTGTDTIFGTSGADVLNLNNGITFTEIEGLDGQGGDDTLTTSDTLAGVTYTGGTGDDTFVLGAADATIFDFAGDGEGGGDLADLSDFGTSFAALDTDVSGFLDDGDAAVAVAGGDLVLSFGGSDYTFLGVTQIDENDLVFV